MLRCHGDLVLNAPTPFLAQGSSMSSTWESRGSSCIWSNAGLVFERLRVRIPAGAAGEFSSPELTLCADSYSVSVLPPCLLSLSDVTDPSHSAKSAGGRLHLNTHTPLIKQVGMSWPCCPGIVWENITEENEQFLRDHSATVISAHWAIVEVELVGASWSPLRTTRRADGEWIIESPPPPNPLKRGKKNPPSSKWDNCVLCFHLNLRLLMIL